MIYVSPKNDVCVANVAINAGMPMVDTIKPFNTPINVETARVRMMATTMGIPILTIK